MTNGFVRSAQAAFTPLQSPLLVNALLNVDALMRSFQEAESHWPYFEKYSSRDQLKAAAKESIDAPVLIGSRSACWKAFLLFEEFDKSKWISQLRDSRATYASTRYHFLRALENQDELDDPLSEDNDSPWNSLRKDEILRDEIFQDVDRCMVDNFFFREPTTQKILTDVLFVWSKLNPDTSYRQGMHEILAPILWVIERDAINLPSTQEKQVKKHHSLLSEMFNGDYIAHDSFTLFNIVMKFAKPSYEQSSGRIVSSRSTATSRDQAAIVKRSENIVNRMLGKADPQLSSHLKDIQIVPQVFLMRWIRLLFGREFSFDQTLHLWDRIFAENPSGECVDLICLAMLLRIRWDLLECDNGGALSLLLHYPEPLASQPPSTLVDDALYLMTNLNFEGGSYIIALRTQRAPLKPSRPSTPLSPRGAFSGLIAPGRLAEQSGSLEGMLQEAAREVYSRGEKWGVNQAVRDAVQEVRRNVQGHSRSQSQNRHQSPPSNNANSSVEELFKKVKSMDERNKALAKMLESAVGELWKQQKEISREKSPGEDTTETLTMAIAKVQLVQVYLEDASLTLPVNDSASNISIHGRVMEHASQPNTNSSRKEAAQPPATPPHQHPTVLKQGSADGEDEKKLDSSAIAESPSQSPAPGKRLSRPPLKESTFSWILGQDDTASHSPRSTFMNTTSPFSMPVEQRKSTARSSAAYLFGEEDNEDDGPAFIARPGRRGSKAKDKSKNPDEDDVEEAFRLGVLKAK